MTSNYDRFISRLKDENEENIKKVQKEMAEMTTALVIIKPQKLIINKPNKPSQRKKIINAMNKAKELNENSNEYIEPLDILFEQEKSNNNSNIDDLLSWDDSNSNEEIINLVDDISNDISNININPHQPFEVDYEAVNNQIKEIENEKANDKSDSIDNEINSEFDSEIKKANDKSDSIDNEVESEVNEIDNEVIDKIDSSTNLEIDESTIDDKIEKTDLEINNIDDKNDNQYYSNSQSYSRQKEKSKGFFAKIKKLFI